MTLQIKNFLLIFLYKIIYNNKTFYINLNVNKKYKISHNDSVKKERKTSKKKIKKN
jgi:hypothetical protein